MERYNRFVEFTATEAQTEFILPDAPVAASGVLVFYNGTAHHTTASFTVTGMTLDWTGPDMAAGEKLYVYYQSPADLDYVFYVHYPVYPSSSTQIVLNDKPQSPVMVIRDLIVYVDAFTISENVLNWTGYPLDPNKQVTVLYKVEHV